MDKKKQQFLSDSMAWYHYNAGETDAQIAEACGVSVNTVRNWRKRNSLACNQAWADHKKKRKLTQLELDAKAARAAGMTYGQYKVSQRKGEIR